jgi:hypothetical protein
MVITMFNRAFPRALRTAKAFTRTNPPPPPPPLHTQVVKLSSFTTPTWRSQSTRHSSFGAAAKKLFKEDPFSVTLASSMYHFNLLPQPTPEKRGESPRRTSKLTFWVL